CSRFTGPDRAQQPVANAYPAPDAALVRRPFVNRREDEVVGPQKLAKFWSSLLSDTSRFPEVLLGEHRLENLSLSHFEAVSVEQRRGQQLLHGGDRNLSDLAAEERSEGASLLNGCRFVLHLHHGQTVPRSFVVGEGQEEPVLILVLF